MSLNKTKCCYSIGLAHGNGPATTHPNRTPPLSPALACATMPERPPPASTGRAPCRSPPTLSFSPRGAPEPTPRPIFFLDAARVPILFFFLLRLEPPTTAPGTTLRHRLALMSELTIRREPWPSAASTRYATVSFSGREPPPSSMTLRSCPATPSRRPRPSMPGLPQVHSRGPFW
jgi:hypothetical protein